MEYIKKTSKEFKLKEYGDDEYQRQIKDLAIHLKRLDKSRSVTPSEFKKVENQARILKLLEIQEIKKTLDEKIKKETLAEIKNDLPNEPKKLKEEPKVIEPTKCPPPPTFTGSKIETPTSESDTDCFIVEAESSVIPPIILKTIQPKPDFKLDLSPLFRNILIKLTGVQMKKICKDARYKIRRKERNIEAADVVIDGVIALPDTVTPIKPQVLINKPILTQKLLPKQVFPQKLVPKPVVVQKPVLVQKPVVKTIPQTNGSKPQPTQQMKVVPVSKPNTTNGNPTMKRCSTPVKIQMIDKKQKVDNSVQENIEIENPLKVYIYNETIHGGKITNPQSGILSQKLLQLIDQDTSSKNGHLIRFDRYKLENGLFTITCANEFARDWLREKMSLLQNLWQSAELRLTQNILRISNFTRLSVFVPGSTVEPALSILKRIARQNPMLNTEKWEIIGYYPKKNNGIQLVLGMDEDSYNGIQLLGMRPYYGLTRLTFRDKVIEPK